MKIVKLLLKISLIKTIYFNFKYLPFNQAIYLPIFLFSPVLKKMDGKIIIDSDNFKTGMIRLGESIVSLYGNGKQGILWENRGVIVFKGLLSIGAGSAISTGENGVLKFGDNFKATTNFRLACYNSIIIGDNVRIAWENILMDTSFHKLKDTNGKQRGSALGKIVIGNNNWITTRCMIMKGAKTPDYCIFGAGSIITKDYSNFPTHILLAGHPLEIKATNIWRDINDDGME